MLYPPKRRYLWVLLLKKHAESTALACDALPAYTPLPFAAAASAAHVK